MMTKHNILIPAMAAILAGFRYPVAFENKNGWKLDADGKIVMKDGNPVYLDSNGNEMTVEGGTISRLNAEAKSHREAKEAAETKLKTFGDLDPEKARKAIETVGKIDAKTLIDAGEVDKVRETISKEFTAQLNTEREKNTGLQGQLDNLTKTTAFKSSKFIQDRVAVPAEMFEATFGKHFKVEGGKVVPYGVDGNPVYSSKRVGEIADLDEALEKIVENYPHKDIILKAPNAGGSGNNGGGGNRGGGRFINRSEFDKMAPNEQAALAGQMGKGEVTIVDGR